MKISVASDHAGYKLKQHLVKVLGELGHQVQDHGCYDEERVDYPDYAARVAKDVQGGGCDYGVLVCGTGIGMAITANKFKGVRAATLTDEYSAIMARKHNDANVLCLGGRVLGEGAATLILETFLSTPFEGEERHRERLAKIAKLEK